MPPETIENPIINSPFIEPTRHFKFDDDGITNEIIESRRPSSYFVPIPAARKKGKKQLDFGTEWTGDRVEENDFINQVRKRVSIWRTGHYAGVTRTTRELLEYWQGADRVRLLFFAQVEALETLIYISEVANKYGDQWIANKIRDGNADANPLLERMAIKMATGSGKTVVMAMIIAWQTLNKVASPQDNRFTDTFLVVTPGITIKDRLRVLQPNDPENYYEALDLVPSGRKEELLRAKVLITNFHAFQQREKGDGSRLTKKLSGQEQTGINKESPAEMVRRVLRDVGNKKQIIVLNDEAHHCYRRRVGGDVDETALKGEEKQEAKRQNEEARIWISGLEAVKQKIGIKAIYDLSATPFFLRGSGYGEGSLFQWVVSDFSLVDAIEAGVVKIPRVPISDDAMDPEGPTYRNLWLKIREDLPRKGAATEKVEGEPKLPAELQGALHSLYANYEKSYQRWEKNRTTETPPVFIVVCNNTNVSRLVYRYVSGWAKPVGDDGRFVVVPGAFPIFNNESGGGWTPRPNTILVDSAQLESGEAMSAEFKKAATEEIREFKDYLRQRGVADAEQISDEDLLREVMNTVGKPGKLGEQVKCVVSVSMLTEGWDANTVTHVLGVRAFGTQLLCEQVVGRGLRRMSYATDENGMFTPEYAEVYGVPFSFIPASGAGKDPPPSRPTTRVRALEERVEKEITFPRVVGYKYEIPDGRLEASFSAESQFSLSPQEVPTEVEIAAIVGEREMHRLDDLLAQRLQTVAFTLARETLKKYFTRDNGNVEPWVFPQLLQIARRWIDECVTTRGNAFKQLLLLHQFRDEAIERIYNAVVRADSGPKRLKPILRPYDTQGSTRYVAFDTTKPVWLTDPEKSQISHVAGDSNWEHIVARELEGIDAVESYVKNQGLNFTIPYTNEGEERAYYPDYIVRLRVPDEEEPLNVVIEVTGQGKRDKQAKVDTARTLWVPAVNNHGGLGRWEFIEVTDPYEAARVVRALASRKEVVGAGI